VNAHNSLRIKWKGHRKLRGPTVVLKRKVEGGRRVSYRVQRPLRNDQPQQPSSRMDTGKKEQSSPQA